MSLMNTVFTKYLDKFVIIYLYDILVYRKDWETHLEHIDKTLEVLRKQKLYANVSKCSFGVQK